MPASPRVTFIGRSQPRTVLDLRELWEYRELLTVLVWRDVKVRYKHTAVGAAWVLLQPLLSMLALTLFASLTRMPSGELPYPFFALSGLVLWTYFVHASTQATYSLVNHEPLLTKVYFPRVILPMAAVLGGSIDFFAAALLLPIFMMYYGVSASAAIVTLPLFLLLALAIGLAAGLWLAVLNVEYRDVANALPFATQLLFFLTPIAYPTALLPEPWRVVAALNPTVGLIEGFRWALCGVASPSLGSSLVESVLVTAGLLASGLVYFQRKQETFADVM